MSSKHGDDIPSREITPESTYLSRRTFLRAAGVSLSLPWLEAMGANSASLTRAGSIAAAEIPRRLGEWLTEAGLELVVVKAHLGEPLPADLEGVGALVVMGGDQHAYPAPGGAAGADWFPALEGLLRKAVRGGVPTLGVCLGGQLLAAAHAGTVEKSAAGPEIGKLRSDYTTYSSYWWYHTGSLDGTDTLMLEASWKDWTYSILFDRRPTDGSSYTDSLVTPMQSILEGLNAWPAALKCAGDFTNDQWLTLDDITLFSQALALGNKSAFDAINPTARYLAGDFDGNGVVNTSDMTGFIGALQHAGVPAEYISLVPEPPTLAIVVMGMLALGAVARCRPSASVRLS